MKMLFLNFGKPLRSLLPIGLLVLSGFVRESHAQSSPLGTWDFVLKGKRSGTAYITFSDDGTNRTFSGVEVLVPNPPSTQSVVGRGGGGTTRNGSGSSTNNLNATQIFGEEPIDGVWNIDNKGRVIGYFIETSMLENCTTNPFLLNTNSALRTNPAPSLAITNFDGICGESTFTVTNFSISTNIEGSVTNYVEADVCFTNIVVCQAITNAISFVGTISPNPTKPKFTLKATTPFGSTMYKGVQAIELPDISGKYYATRKQNGVVYNEFFTLSNIGGNYYYVALTGPGYSYEGYSILSSQKAISFGLALVPALPTDPITVIRAVSGPFNVTTKTGSTSGWDQQQGDFIGLERFNVYYMGP